MGWLIHLAFGSTAPVPKMSSSAGALETEATGRADEKGKSKSKAQPDNLASFGSGKYISVFDFFKTST
jgi:hypothetical protein